MSDPNHRLRGWPCRATDPGALVGHFIRRADDERLLRCMLDRDDHSRATERLREVLAQREEAWLVAASWLAQLLNSRGRAEDDEVLWGVVERWAARASLSDSLGEQTSVWASASGELAVTLMVRGGEGQRPPGNSPNDEPAG